MSTKLEARLLVVDDDRSQRSLLAGFLRDLGAEVREADNGRSALEVVGRGRIDVVITDLRMPEMDGEELLREIQSSNPDIKTIMVTAYGTVQGAVSCLKSGAFDYLLKPLDLDEVEHVVRKAVEDRRLRRENRELRRRLGEVESIPGIVTGGGSMAEVLSTVVRVADSSVPVLVLGRAVRARN